ncbi:hypothetical protein THAOC_11953 [Thalassiosira oceanica]|uniref:Iron hydrogenase large subunit C-terminal domain-containing protein n=1 Tax=Thalassiosira oceanica TaxID=159749 RepID=K0SNW4_THAOC|nr:hypothetical protein THAOC_11953 [Thalassiosira oceanica]|eukprot:EJK67060.1 hypothetical protein THAOC_11953 [Thalassiosira oceanica]
MEDTRPERRRTSRQQRPLPTFPRRPEHDGHGVTVKSKPKAVTLSDCLSCSGCVTSAEAVLMSRHSADALREEAARAAAGEIGEGGGSGARRNLVFTLSPASLADLRRHLYEEGGGGGEDNKTASAQGEGKTAHPTRREFLHDVANFICDEFGATLVIDGSVPQRASLEEAAAEFRRRYEDDAKLGSGGKGAGLPDTPPPSVALSSTRTRFVEKRPGDGGEEEVDVTVVEHPPGLVLEEDLAMGLGDRPSADHASKIVAGNPRLPVLSSSCPGFVCLAEKTAPAAKLRGPVPRRGHALPRQEAGGRAGRPDMGGRVMSRLLWGSSDAEGSEKGADGLENGGMVREVDLVITTGELLGLLGTAAGAGDDGDRVEPAAVRSYLDKRKRSRKDDGGLAARGRPTLVSIDDEDEEGGGGREQTIPPPSASSGATCPARGRYRGGEPRTAGPFLRLPKAAAGDGGGLIRRRRRRGAAGGEASSADIRELTLYAHADGTHSCDGSSSPSSVPVLRFAAAYGFKNVQSVLRGLSSPGTTAGGEGRRYDYVEVMACPSGCANGGGQVGPGGRKEMPRGARERARAVASAVPVVRPPGAAGLSADGSGGGASYSVGLRL